MLIFKGLVFYKLFLLVVTLLKPAVGGILHPMLMWGGFFFFFSLAYFDYKDESGFPKPPSYNVATTLPSYDEAERTKAEATIPLVPGRVSWLLCLHVPKGLFWEFDASK